MSVVDLIAYPFRFAPGGSVDTVGEGYDDALSPELAVAVLTLRGERDLVPDFGIADPTFAGVDADALRLQVQLFGPPVTVDDVLIEVTGDYSQDVTVSFSPAEL